jgi:hypothetical protein
MSGVNVVCEHLFRHFGSAYFIEQCKLIKITCSDGVSSFKANVWSSFYDAVKLDYELRVMFGLIKLE